jgi:hypothetical protein
MRQTCHINAVTIHLNEKQKPQFKTATDYSEHMTTSAIRFDRKDVVPDDPELKKVLKGVHPAYMEILTLIDGFSREWKFYGQRLGWQLKVTQKGKALFYLIPEDGSFRMGLAVREKEKEVLLNSKLPAKAKEDLANAKRYPEGYPLKLQVKRESDMKAVRLVLGILKEMRP